jgi:uncharacterized protein (DUF2342 family)
MTDDIMVSKRQALREEMKRRRSQMTPEQIRAASERIGLRIMELEPVKRARTLSQKSRGKRGQQAIRQIKGSLHH